jgi:REP element-mobilizing transposase RayT
MNKLQNRKTPRWQKHDYDRNGAYFITICTRDRKCILSRIVGTGVLDCPEVSLTSHGKIAEKYIKQLDSFYSHISVKSFVIMPNHIHALLVLEERGQSRTSVPTENDGAGSSAPKNVERSNNAIPMFISTFKRFCNKEFGENIWQARYYDHVIRDQEDYVAHLKYIQKNPANWLLDELHPACIAEQNDPDRP